MPRKSRKKGGNPLRLTLCQDFKRTGRAPVSDAEKVCCNKDKNCKNKNKKTSKVRGRSASQREGQMEKMKKYSRDRKMKPGEKLGDYGSHCVNAAGRRWGHTKPRWNNREGDPEEGIAVQNLRNWHPSPESLMQPPPEFNPGKKMAGNPLVCREDGWTGAEGGYRGEWCLLDPVAGFGSLMKNNLASSDKQLCRTRYAKNWLSDNKLTLVAAKKAGYFFDDNEKYQAIEDARKKRIMTEGVKLRAELQAEEKRRKAAVNRENERKQKLVSAGVQAQAHDFAEKNTFFDAKENDDDDEFFDAQSGGRVAWLPVEQGENNIVDFLNMYIDKNIKFLLTEGNSWETAMGDGGGGEGKLNKVLTFRRQGDDERAPAPHVGFSIINDDHEFGQWFSTGRDQHFEFFQVYKPMKSARKTGVAHRVKAQRGVAHGGRRRTRRRRKNRRKRGGRRKSRRVRRRKTRRKTRRKRGGTSCPPEKEPLKKHLIDCPGRRYQACCETEAKEGKEKCQIVAGGKDEEGARAICVPTNVIDLT